MATMTREKREAFLSDPRIAVLAVARNEGPPSASPVWYAYEPGGDVRVQTYVGALKHTLMTKREAFTLVVHNDEAPYEYVSVEGRLVGAPEPASREAIVALAERYLDGEPLAAYLASIEDLDMVEFTMRPDRWFAADQL